MRRGTGEQSGLDERGRDTNAARPIVPVVFEGATHPQLA